MKSFMKSWHMLFRHWKPLIDAVNGTVAMTLEKLPNIWVDLVRHYTEWEEWTCIQFAEGGQGRADVGESTVQQVIREI